MVGEHEVEEKGKVGENEVDEKGILRAININSLSQKLDFFYFDQLTYLLTLPCRASSLITIIF